MMFEQVAVLLLKAASQWRRVTSEGGGLKYPAAAQAITRFRKRLNRDKKLVRTVRNLSKQVSTI